MGFSFGERDVKTGGDAHQSILSKQDILYELATGKLPFDTRVSKPKVQKPKIQDNSPEEAKVEEAKVEEAKVEEAKVEETKIEEAKVEETKIEEAKVEEAKVEKVTVEKVTVEKEKPQEAIPISIIESNTPTGCVYKMMRGERKGESCNKPCSKDSAFCKTHK